jgi:hypothetical protein
MNEDSKKTLSDNLLKKEANSQQEKPPEDAASCSYDDRKLPSLPKFSGSNAKGETTYRRWKFEVCELSQSGCPESKLKRAIHKSLFGLAADTFMYLGKDSAVSTILQKFDVLYMTNEDDESTLAQFYSATQHKDESLPAWFTRLESMLNADCLALSQVQKDKMLRSRFWKGLSCETIKSGLRHRYDNGATAMELLQAARQIYEEDSKAKSAQCNIRQVHSGSNQQDVLSNLMDKMSTLQTRFEEFDARLKGNSGHQSSFPQSSRSFNGTCFKCKRYGHKASNCRSKSKNTANLNSNVPVQGGHLAQKENPPQGQQR